MTPIDKAIEIVGGQISLASKLGVNQSFISQIRTGARPIPATLCPKIQKVTGNQIKCAELRPDVFEVEEAA